MLLGYNTGVGVVMLRPIRLQFVGLWISTEHPCVCVRACVCICMYMIT
jgi:hypothetical protein